MTEAARRKESVPPFTPLKEESAASKPEQVAGKVESIPIPSQSGPSLESVSRKISVAAPQSEGLGWKALSALGWAGKQVGRAGIWGGKALVSSAVQTAQFTYENAPLIRAATDQATKLAASTIQALPAMTAAIEEIPVIGGTIQGTRRAMTAAITSGAQAAYESIPGVAQAVTQHVTEPLLDQILPQADLFKVKLAEGRKELDDKTKSSIVSEACSIFAQCGTEFLRHYILTAHEIEPGMGLEWVEELFLQKRKEGQATQEYTFLGDVAKMTLKKRSELIADTIELNLQKMFSNLTTSLKTLQEENPQLLRNIVELAFDQIIANLKKGKAVSKEELNIEFFKAISKMLLSYALPQGEKDIELPPLHIPGKERVSELFTKHLHTSMQEHILPNILFNAANSLQSDYSRDSWLLYGLKKANEFMEKTLHQTEVQETQEAQKALAEPKPPQEKPPLPQDEERFHSSFAKCGAALFHFIDPELAKQVDKLANVEKLIKQNAPQVSEALQSVNLVTDCLNPLMKGAVSGAVEGHWSGETFLPDNPTQPFEFYKSKKDEIAYKEKWEKDRQERIVPELPQIAEEISEKLPAFVGQVTAKAVVAETVKQSSSFLETLSMKLRNAWRNFVGALITAIAKKTKLKSSPQRIVEKFAPHTQRGSPPLPSKAQPLKKKR